MLVPRYTTLPTVRAPTGLGQFMPPTSQPLPSAGELVIQCLNRRGVPEDSRTPLVTLMCAADETRPLIAEMQTRYEMFARWIAAFEAGTTLPDVYDREDERRYRRLRKSITERSGQLAASTTTAIHGFTTALNAVDQRLRKYAAEQEQFDALWRDLDVPADRAQLLELQKQASAERLSFYQNAVLPLLVLAIEFVANLRRLSALSGEAIKNDMEWMATIDGFLSDTIQALKRSEGQRDSLLAKLSRLVLGKDPFGTVLAGVVLVGIGLAAFFILPPLFRGLGERFEAKSKSKREKES